MDDQTTTTTSTSDRDARIIADRERNHREQVERNARARADFLGRRDTETKLSPTTDGVHATPSFDWSSAVARFGTAAAIVAGTVSIGGYLLANASAIAALAGAVKTAIGLFPKSEDAPVSTGLVLPAATKKRGWSRSIVIATTCGAAVLGAAALIVFPTIALPILVRKQIRCVDLVQRYDTELDWELDPSDPYTKPADYKSVMEWNIEWAGYSSVKVAAVAAACCLLGYAGYKLFVHWWRRQQNPIGASWTSKYIAKTLRTSPLSSSQQRQAFIDVPLAKAFAQSNHTHGQSAADRNAGSATCGLIAMALGYTPHYMQMSLSDVKKGRTGSRSYHWVKDLSVPVSNAEFDPKTQAACLVDVDHYINMPKLLAERPGTYLISTFQPTAAAKGDGEYAFRFLEDGRVQYIVSGGEEYVHEIWDYSGTTIVVEDTAYLQKRISGYHIDRKFIDEHHCIVMLSLIGTFDAPSLCPADWFVEGNKLKRLNPVCGTFVALDIKRGASFDRSCALLGDHLAVTMPKVTWDAMRSVAINNRVPITAATVASNIYPTDPAGLPTERLPPGHAATIAVVIRQGVPFFPPRVYPPSECMLVTLFDKHDFTAKVPLAGFGSPLIWSCYGFPESIASEDRCISGRVEAFQNRPEQGCMPSTAGYMTEFAVRLIPIPHRGHPVGHAEVGVRQNSPSQRAILERAAVTGANFRAKWSAFVKKETQQKATDPRNISQMEAATKLAYACFMYAFHDEVMSAQDWYAFNKTPRECAERIAAFLCDEAHCVLADGSRFDGHVSRLARLLERICMLRFFAQEHHSEVNECMDQQIGIPGVTTLGRKYFSGYSRGSGSQETSDFNSIITAFIDYCAWRNTLVNGVKLTADQAWAKLGIYGGDDSLAGAVDPVALKKSAEIMGQDYEITVVRRDEIGVEFLNRQFGPDVWNGDVNSMANPSRLLSKLWVGPFKLLQPLQRFAERCSGYYRMDRNSPVIGEITRVSHELLGERVDGELMPWDGRYSIEANWPNEDSGWMNDVFNKFVPDFDWERFSKWIQECLDSGNPDLLLSAPLCTGSAPEFKVKQTCVVGEELHIVPPKDKGEAFDDESAWHHPVLRPEPKDRVTTPLDWDEELLDTDEESDVDQDEVYHYVDDKIGFVQGKDLPKFAIPSDDLSKPYGEQGVILTPAEVSQVDDYHLRWQAQGEDLGKGFIFTPVDTSTFETVKSKRATRRKPVMPPAVVEAEKAVPVVGEDGKRAVKVPKGRSVKPAVRGTPRVANVVPKKDMKDPRNWTPPIQFRDESTLDYAVRVDAWKSKRALVIKRLGITLK